MRRAMIAALALGAVLVLGVVAANGVSAKHVELAEPGGGVLTTGQEVRLELRFGICASSLERVWLFHGHLESMNRATGTYNMAIEHAEKVCSTGSLDAVTGTATEVVVREGTATVNGAVEIEHLVSPDSGILCYYDSNLLSVKLPIPGWTSAQGKVKATLNTQKSNPQCKKLVGRFFRDDFALVLSGPKEWFTT